jgi:hypothetical protein
LVRHCKGFYIFYTFDFLFVKNLAFPLRTSSLLLAAKHGADGLIKPKNCLYRKFAHLAGADWLSTLLRFGLAGHWYLVPFYADCFATKCIETD